MGFNPNDPRVKSGQYKRRRPKYKAPKEGEGKRVNVYLKGRSLMMARQIENLSAFMQLALDQAPGIMQWAIMKERRPDLYYDNHKLEDVLPEFNAAYPLDPLTKARKEKKEREWRMNSPKKPELW